jgi:hypothetical protein
MGKYGAGEKWLVNSVHLQLMSYVRLPAGRQPHHRYYNLVTLSAMLYTKSIIVFKGSVIELSICAYICVARRKYLVRLWIVITIRRKVTDQLFLLLCNSCRKKCFRKWKVWEPV